MNMQINSNQGVLIDQWSELENVFALRSNECRHLQATARTHVPALTTRRWRARERKADSLGQNLRWRLRLELDL